MALLGTNVMTLALNPRYSPSTPSVLSGCKTDGPLEVEQPVLTHCADDDSQFRTQSVRAICQGAVFPRKAPYTVAYRVHSAQ